MAAYFINKRSLSTQPYQIVFREVKTRTSKGYPISYELIPLPEKYHTWEEALEATRKLNAPSQYNWQSESVCPPWPY